jgi:hypothetical protein
MPGFVFWLRLALSLFDKADQIEQTMHALRFDLKIGSSLVIPLRCTFAWATNPCSQR